VIATARSIRWLGTLPHQPSRDTPDLLTPLLDAL
jgi:hypothetical protein